MHYARTTLGAVILPLLLGGCAALDKPDTTARGSLNPGETVRELDQLQWDAGACDDCSPIDVEPCDLVANSDTIVIIESDEYDGRRVDTEVMLCKGNDRYTRYVDVIGVVWGDPVEPGEIEIFDAGEFAATGQAIVGLRKSEGFWTETFSWRVETGVSNAQPVPGLDFPVRFDELHQAFQQAGNDSQCLDGELNDAEWSDRNFSQCRIGEDPAHPYGNGCDYVVDRFIFECDRSVQEALDIAAECDADVQASPGDGNSSTGAGRITNCYQQLDCAVTAKDAAAACSMEVNARCQPVADVVTGCGESESYAYEVATRYCTEVIDGLSDADADAYIQCASQLPCDLIISGYAPDECPV